MSTIISLGGVVGPASAAEPPQLTSLSVAPTTVTPPGEVVVEYAAEADTATLGTVSVKFASPVSARGDVILTRTSAPLGGDLRWTVPDGLRNAAYTLSTVTVSSLDGTASTVYRRDGSTSRGGSHSFDFPGKDVTVTGSNEDFTGPLLRTVTVATPAVEPGGVVTVDWVAEEDHGWRSATFYFAGVDRPGGLTLTSSSASQLDAGRIKMTVPATVYNGRHTLRQVILVDSLGNQTSYHADGRLMATGYDTPTETTSHTLALGSAEVMVSGSKYDKAPPILRSISLDRRSVATYEPVKVAYVTDEDSAPLEQVVLRYSRPESSWLVDLGASNLPVAGSFSTTLSEGGFPGRLTLEHVELMDGAGNTVRYWRDGKTRTPSGAVSGTHTLDLTTLDLTVTPQPVLLSARSRPRSAALTWSVGGEAQGITGYRVTVSPGGRAIDVPGNATGSHSIVVSGLINATRYTFSITPETVAGDGPTTTASATPLLSGNVFGAGDVNVDGKADLFAHLPNGPVRLYRGKGGAVYGSGTAVVDMVGTESYPADRFFGEAAFYTKGWNGVEAVLVPRNGVSQGGLVMESRWDGMRFLDGSADFTGDRVADLVGVTPAGNAYLYKGTSTAARFATGVRIATGWATMQRVFAASDVTGDGRADLLGVDEAGVLWIFPGTGKGTFTARRQVGSGWGSLGGVFFARDVNNDGRGDLGGVTMDGTLRIYAGRGNGTFKSAVVVSKGWAAYL